MRGEGGHRLVAETPPLLLRMTYVIIAVVIFPNWQIQLPLWYYRTTITTNHHHHHHLYQY